ncbi:MAG: CinA family protein [Ktedonobacterales bacterium]
MSVSGNSDQSSSGALFLSASIGRLLSQQRMTVATMESITGGLLASTITDIAGSSAYMRGGIVSYATDLKLKIGVPAATVDAHGVISAETAIAMAQAVKQFCTSDIGVGITGVAGPEEQEGRPVGEVHIGIASAQREDVRTFQFGGDRIAIKQQAITAALHDLLDQLQY